MQKRKIKQKYLYPNQAETYLLRSSPQGHLWLDRDKQERYDGTPGSGKPSSPEKKVSPSGATALQTLLTTEMQSVCLAEGRVSDAHQSGKRGLQQMQASVASAVVSGAEPHDFFGFGKDQGDLKSPPDLSRTRTRAPNKSLTSEPTRNEKKTGVPRVGTRIDSPTHALYAKRFVKLAYALGGAPSHLYQLTQALQVSPHSVKRVRNRQRQKSKWEEGSFGDLSLCRLISGASYDARALALKGKSAAVPLFPQNHSFTQAKARGVKDLNSRKKTQAFSLIETVKQLEHRLDTLVYKAGFSRTIAEAKQMINHQYVSLNQVKVNLPGSLLQPGDLFRLQPAANWKRWRRLSGDSSHALETQKFLPLTHVLEIDGNTAIYLTHPNQAEYSV